MAFTSTGLIGTIATTNGNSALIKNTTPVDSGKLVIVAVAKDNYTTSDGSTSDITVSDNINNGYIKIYENTNANAGVGNGVTTALWYSMISTTIPEYQPPRLGLGNNWGINVINNYSGAGDGTAGMVAWAWGFTFNRAQNMIEVSGQTTGSVDANAFGSLTISGLTSKEYLFIRVTGAEGTPTPVVTASHTVMGTQAGTNLKCWGEFRILTSTADTSNPTSTGTVDNASIMVALSEKLAVTPMFFASNF